MSAPYINPGPTKAEIDARLDPLVLEFGTDWCSFCQAAESYIESGLAGFPSITHLKVEDGPGRPLGRSFRVKLWPTLIVLKDGKELARVVRPQSADEVRKAATLLASNI